MIWKNKQSSSLSEKKDFINKSEFFRGFEFLEEIKLDNRLANPEFNCQSFQVNYEGKIAIFSQKKIFQ
jgi:hypothetical protein